MVCVKLVNIFDLFDKNFSIPSYQRGYRWTTRQVEDLLEDILDFQKKLNKQPGEFYCLQPLVVKKLSQTEYEVIDGQQRLTTLYLILLYFEVLIKKTFRKEKKHWYTINYGTREDFINSSLNDNNSEKIDNYYISDAKKFIKEWIDKKVGNNESNNVEYLNTFLKKDIRAVDQQDIDIANNVRFIWYEITEENLSGSAIFTRINMGKIPLTNAELIKALFFINEKEEDRIKHQFSKAYEWEYIEKSLQNDDFWYFLNKEENATPTRIEFIFELIADKYKDKYKDNLKNINKVDKYYAYYIFNELIKSKIYIKEKGGDIAKDSIREDLWDEVKSYFRMFEEWFNHNEYYHLIGYVIHCGEKIDNIINIYTKSTKERFLSELKNKIKSYVQYKDEYKKDDYKNSIKQFDYEEKRKTIMNILLLFNIILTMKSKYTRFPFDLFIKEKWSLEHIHAQNSEEIFENKHESYSLLKSQLEYIQKKKEQELINEINELLKKNNQGLLFGAKDIDELINELDKIKKEYETNNLNKNIFKDLQELVFKHYSYDNFEDIHYIDNLALLSTRDNSTLSNNIFPIKREKIIELDTEGRFIPIGTKNVFLKYFSKESENNIKWTQEDRVQYLDEISKKITEFFNNDNGE